MYKYPLGRSGASPTKDMTNLVDTDTWLLFILVVVIRQKFLISLFLLPKSCFDYDFDPCYQNETLYLSQGLMGLWRSIMDQVTKQYFQRRNKFPLNWNDKIVHFE